MVLGQSYEQKLILITTLISHEKMKGKKNKKPSEKYYRKYLHELEIVKYFFKLVQRINYNNKN